VVRFPPGTPSLGRKVLTQIQESYTQLRKNTPGEKGKQNIPRKNNVRNYDIIYKKECRELHQYESRWLYSYMNIIYSDVIVQFCSRIKYKENPVE
jgi:hypothetical protein